MSTNWYDDPSAPLSRDDVRNEIQNFLQSQSAASSYAPKGTPWQAVDLPLVTVLPAKPQGRDEVNLLNTVTNGVTRWVYLTKTSAWAQISGPPIGVIEWTCAAAAPLGYLIADGTAVSRITYAGLFALCSTTYGVGDGSTTFNLPDLKGRVPVGVGTGAGGGLSSTGRPTGGQPLTPRSLGAYDGDERLHAHIHTATDSGHVHNTSRVYTDIAGEHQHSYRTLFAAGQQNYAQGTDTNTNGMQNASAVITVASNTQGGLTQNMQPSLVLTPIIRT